METKKEYVVQELEVCLEEYRRDRQAAEKRQEAYQGKLYSR